jgi:hypothetical protein
MSFTNFLLLVLVKLVGVSSPYFYIGAFRNEMTLLATPKAWSLGSPLRLGLVFVLVLVKETTLFEHFVELPHKESHLLGSHVHVTIFITIFLDYGL